MRDHRLVRKPRVLAPRSWIQSGPWVGVHSSHRPSGTSAVQFIGSMVGMRLKWSLVHRLDALRRARQGLRNVAFIPPHVGCRLTRDVLKDLLQRCTALVCVRALVPIYFQRLAALDCCPGGIGDHCHATEGVHRTWNRRNLENVPYARNRVSLRGIKALHVSSKGGTASDDSKEHAGNFDIQTKDSASVNFRRRVQPGGGPADDAKILGVFERHVVRIRRGQPPRGLNQFTVRQPLARGRVKNDSLLRAAARLLDSPGFVPRLRPTFPAPQLLPGAKVSRTNRAAAATRGGVLVDVRLGRGLLNPGPSTNEPPVPLPPSSPRWCGTLPYLCLFHDDSHLAGRADTEPSVG